MDRIHQIKHLKDNFKRKSSIPYKRSTNT